NMEADYNQTPTSNTLSWTSSNINALGVAIEVKAAQGAGPPPDTTAPTITNGISASVSERSQLSFGLTANETVTWSIVGGVDSSSFEISGSTLRWASNGVKD